MTQEDGSDFDSAKAELFEAIGHPNRIRIIQALDQGSMGFAELKKRVGMESSGHLAFHLGKLDHLVAMNTDGQYALTGEGREALSMIQTVRGKRNGGPDIWNRIRMGKSLTRLLVFLVIGLFAIAAIQQVEVASLTSRPTGTVVIDGKNYWYTVIPLQSVTADRNTSILFDGVDFILFPYHYFTLLSVSSSGPVNFTVSTLPGIVGANGTATFAITAMYPNVQVQVRFPDGVTETMYLEHVEVANGTAQVGLGSPPTWPWISYHQSPRVAISENSVAITLYVAAGP